MSHPNHHLHRHNQRRVSNNLHGGVSRVLGHCGTCNLLEEVMPVMATTTTMTTMTTRTTISLPVVRNQVLQCKILVREIPKIILTTS